MIINHVSLSILFFWILIFRKGGAKNVIGWESASPTPLLPSLHCVNIKLYRQKTGTNQWRAFKMTDHLKLYFCLTSISLGQVQKNNKRLMDRRVALNFSNILLNYLLQSNCFLYYFIIIQNIQISLVRITKRVWKVSKEISTWDGEI